MQVMEMPVMAKTVTDRHRSEGPSLTGENELHGAVRAQLCRQEALQHGYAGAAVGVDAQILQTPTGLHQPAAEQSTPQVRHSCHTTTADNRVDRRYSCQDTYCAVDCCWIG